MLTLTATLKEGDIDVEEGNDIDAEAKTEGNVDGGAEARIEVNSMNAHS